MYLIEEWVSEFHCHVIVQNHMKFFFWKKKHTLDFYSCMDDLFPFYNHPCIFHSSSVKQSKSSQLPLVPCQAPHILFKNFNKISNIQIINNISLFILYLQLGIGPERWYQPLSQPKGLDHSMANMRSKINNSV